MSLTPFGLHADSPLRHIERFLATARSVRAGKGGHGYDPPDTAITGAVADREMPIYVGARGPRLNRLASAMADGAFVAGLPPFRYGQVIGWARETNAIDVALYPSVAFDDAAIEHHRPEMIWSLLDAPATVSAALGIDATELSGAAEELRRGNRRPATAIVTDELLPQLMLTGSPSSVGRRLAALVKQHRPTSIGLALLQPDLEAGFDDAAAAFETMGSILKAIPR